MTRQRRRNIPKPWLIESKRQRRGTPHEMIAELCDNALDEEKGQALEVRIELGKNDLKVWDRGLGVEDINAITTLGQTIHDESSASIGRYGVGATDACIWLGEAVTVTTIYNGRLHTHNVDWSRCLKRGEWPLSHTGDGLRPSRKNIPEELRGKGRGTLVHIQRRLRGRNPQVPKLCEELGKLYEPGLRAGKRILVRRTPGDWRDVVPPTPPAFVKRISFESEAMGRRYRCTAYLYEKASPDFSGFRVGYDHRIVLRTERFYRDGNVAPRFGAYIGFSPDWRTHLSDHKDDIVDGKVELGEDVYRHCEELIKEGIQLDRNVYVANLEAKLSGMLSQSLGSIGGPHPGAGSSSSQDDGGRGTGGHSGGGGRGFAAERKPGNEMEGIPGGITVRFQEDQDQVCHIVQTDRTGGGYCFTANVSLEYEQVRTAHEHPANLPALQMLVCSALSAHIANRAVYEGEPIEAYIPALRPVLRGSPDFTKVNEQVLSYCVDKSELARGQVPGAKAA